MAEHQDAFEVSLKASAQLQSPENSALVVLGRTLARQMDDAGEKPSTRLSAAYLSVLKDVGRITAREFRPTRGSKARVLSDLRERAAYSRPKAVG